MAEAAASDAAEVHVLAVDDCLIDRVLIGRLLSSDSVKVTTVDSALSALELLGLQDEHRASSNACCNPLNFSLIITDYCMPGMTGYDLLKKLKGSKDFKEIPVVVMSSESVPQRIQRCLEEGAKDFILKPVQLKDVKKLRGHIKRTKSTSVPPICGKRKVSSIVIRGEESERRHHLGGVTVA